MAITEIFKADITTALGGNLIDVELTDDDFDYAFDKAIRQFQQRGNNNLDRKFITLSAVTDTLTYTIDSAENVDTIVRIIKPQNVYSQADPFYSSFVQQFWGNIYKAGESMANYELSRQLLESYDKYTIKDTQFIWKKNRNELTLLDNPKTSATWGLEVYADLTNDEYEDVFWVREYTIAEAKILLGTAYRKFQALSTPSGETSLAGQEMIQEGIDAQTTLLENIGDYIDGDPTGSIIIMG